jgi:hypothetical protein
MTLPTHLASAVAELRALGWSVTEPPSTKNCGLASAAICRQRGWGPGTRIVGDEGHGPETIEITAVGETIVLAKSIKYNGPEVMWCLNMRDWTVAT